MVSISSVIHYSHNWVCGPIRIGWNVSPEEPVPSGTKRGRKFWKPSQQSDKARLRSDPGVEKAASPRLAWAALTRKDSLGEEGQSY